MSETPRPAVILVGPPGSGKTSVGGVLSEITGLVFRDTDTDVEAVARRAIPDIFTTDGEAVFRELERQAVAAALVSHSGILSLGGGAVLNDSSRALLAGHAVVFLSVTMPTGVQRTGLARNRPLLIGVNPRATYKALLDARLPLYRQVAKFEVRTDELTVLQVAEWIIDNAGLR